MFPSLVRPQANDTDAALYNVASHAVMGGIGALINKKPDEKRGKVLLKGMYQGALGGYLAFESKRLVRQFSRTGNYAYLWPSKLVNTAGNSITYNAASNRNFWERWHIDYGFSYLEYDFKREKRLRYRVLPFALYGNISGFATAKFDLRRTLYTGQFVFEDSELKSNFVDEVAGVAQVSTVYYDSSLKGLENREIIAHELVHVYQYNDFFAANAYLNGPMAVWDQKSPLLRTYHKVFKTDFNWLLKSGLYGLESTLGVGYEDLFFEREAFYYSRQRF
ncbi:MAG: hypothetical protein ACFCUL_13220 [Flavobacteriaceae bacterium]